MVIPCMTTHRHETRNANWAYPLRFGLFSVSVSDMDCIAQAMAGAMG